MTPNQFDQALDSLEVLHTYAIEHCSGGKKDMTDEMKVVSEALTAAKVLEAERDRCHARLEIDSVWHHWQGYAPERVAVPLDERLRIPDGIECRNDTIEIQAEQIARLTAERDALRKRVEDMRQAVTDRKAIYEAKLQKADPFADDTANQFDKLKHTIEAFEYLEVARAFMESKE